MFLWIKNHFIPHAGNDHKPHLLRWEATLTILSITLFIEVIFLIQALFVFPTHFFGLIFPDALVDLTNQSRVASAATPLRENAFLMIAAKAKAEDMATKGYFAHYAPDGTSPWYWIQSAGYRYAYAGENLAINFVDSRDVVEAWMNSPKHRENIVNGHYTEIGISIATGKYEGRDAVFVVQFFGRPAMALAETGRPAVSQSVAQVAIVPPVPGIPTAESAQPTPLPATSSPAPLPPVPESDFVAVQGEIVETPAVPPEEKVETPRTSNSSVVGRLLSSPRAAVQYLYIVFATLIAAALLLTIFMRLRMPHPRLLVNATLMLIVLAGALSLNHWIALANAGIR